MKIACNCWKWLQLRPTDCNSLKLPEQVATAETDFKWLQLIANDLNYRNRLQLLKSIATDCKELQFTKTIWTGCNCWNRLQMIITDCMWRILVNFGIWMVTWSHNFVPITCSVMSRDTFGILRLRINDSGATVGHSSKSINHLQLPFIRS